jgi:hypothetical protein
MPAPTLVTQPPLATALLSLVVTAPATHGPHWPMVTSAHDAVRDWVLAKESDMGATRQNLNMVPVAVAAVCSAVSGTTLPP